MDNFSGIDITIFISYCLLILGVGLYVSRGKKGITKSTEDYFLAGKSLPWWAIGASLIAANISAEQFIGMSGSGFAIGLAIASYEWMGGVTLLIVGKYFLPIFIKEKIYTIPEFVEKRYSVTLKTILAVFWIGLYVFVNLASVLYLGALAIESIAGLPMIYGILFLALFAAAYSLYGGLAAVAWTDVIQVVFLVLGGLATTYLVLNLVSDDTGVINGAKMIYEAAPDHFQMILSSDNPEYVNLPGIWVLIGGLWVANLYYFGFNQYIIQRTLAAKSLSESQKGIAFAAFLKLIMPFIVVVPGIAAYVVVNDPDLLQSVGVSIKDVTPTAGASDRAYPWLLQLLPSGLKGIAFASLTAAIISSLASMLNSTSTIFTMDIYRQYFSKGSSDTSLVRVGRVAAAVALLIACFAAPLLGGIDQAFQFIQEYTGLVSPGILAVFLLGLFWSGANNQGAIWGALISIPIALSLKFLTSMPWMNQMGFTALSTMAVVILVSLASAKKHIDDKAIQIRMGLFKTSQGFNVSAYLILLIVAALYALFW